MIFIASLVLLLIIYKGIINNIAIFVVRQYMYIQIIRFMWNET